MTQELPAPSSIQPATMDFQALYAKAMAMPETPAAPVTPTPAVEAPATTTAPTSEPPAVVTTPAEAPTPKVLELADDLMVKVKVDGVEQLVPVKDFKDGVQREVAFTKRTQALADQRREAEAQLAAQLAEITKREEALKLAEQKLTAVPDPLQKLLEAMAPAPTAPDPGELATLGDVNAALQRITEEHSALTQKERAAMMAELQVAAQAMREEAALEADRKRFTDSVTTLMSKPEYTTMKDLIPFAEEALRFQVAKLEPETIDQAIEYADKVMAEWAGKLNATQTTALKQAEIARARLTMEPPAGSPVAPTATTKPVSALKKTGGVDWDALRARARQIADAR